MEIRHFSYNGKGGLLNVQISIDLILDKVYNLTEMGTGESVLKVGIVKMEVKMKSKKLIMMSLVCLFLVSAVNAQIITIGFVGVVDNVNDQYGFLENKIHAGDTMTGYYVYDSETPNTSPYSSAEYWHYSLPYGMVLTAGNITFQSDPQNVEFRVGIINGTQDDEFDMYNVGSDQNISLNNGGIINSIGWQLTDYLATAISSTDIPILPPDLSKWQSNGLNIRGCDELDEKKMFGVSGHVTSIYLIPEPLSIALLGLGGLFLRRKS